MNTSINRIEVGNEMISIQTFDATVFMGLIKKDPIKIEIPRNLAQFILAKKKFGFPKKYTGDIYLLLYAGDEYLIESNFFDNFSELKQSIEGD